MNELVVKGNDHEISNLHKTLHEKEEFHVNNHLFFASQQIR